MADEPLETDETGTTDTFTVALGSKPLAAVTVTVSSSASSEATVVEAQPLTFTPPNWADAQTVTLRGLDDGLTDGDQDYAAGFDLSGSTDPAYRDLQPAPVAAVNRDDDRTVVTIEARAAGVTEGDAAVFTLRCTGVTASGLTVAVSVSDVEGVITGTAPGSVVFEPGAGAAELSVPTVDDKSGGTIEVTVTAGTDYEFGTPGSADVAVAENDAAGFIITGPEQLMTDEAGAEDSFVVALASEPVGDVSVTLSSDETEEGTVAPAALTFTPADWADAQGVTLAGVDDHDIDGAQEYAISFSVTSADDGTYDQFWLPPLTAVNGDDEVDTGLPDVVNLALPRVTVVADGEQVAEGNPVSFTLGRVQITEPLALTVRVAVTESESGKVIIGSAPTEVAFRQGEASVQLPLDTADDQIDDADSTITVTIH